MQPISVLTPSTLQPHAAVSGIKAAPEVQRPEGNEQYPSLKAVLDEYVRRRNMSQQAVIGLVKMKQAIPKSILMIQNVTMVQKGLVKMPMAIRRRTALAIPTKQTAKLNG